MKFWFYFYWVFYLSSISLEYLIRPMTAAWANRILCLHWTSYSCFVFIFAIGYCGNKIRGNEQYAEGLFAAFIARFLLQIAEIYQYQEKKYIILVTGFVMIAWLGLNLKRRFDRETDDNYYNW